MANTAQFPGTVDQIENNFNKVNEIRASATNVQYPSALAVLNFVYPIGCLYWSRISTPPSELFGGTWRQIQGKVVVAAGTYTDKNGEERSFEVGETDNGEYNHTLTDKEIPKHRHTGLYWGSESSSIGLNDGDTTVHKLHYGGSGAANMFVTGETGGNLPHNNMPPYEVFYCWERIA